MGNCSKSTSEFNIRKNSPSHFEPRTYVWLTKKLPRRGWPLVRNISSYRFAVQSTYHTTLQFNPGQLVFRRDIKLNIPFIADWEAIRTRKKKRRYKNNKLENKNCKPHTYIIHKELLVCNKQENMCEEPYVRPYLINQVLTNGNVTIRWGNVQEWIKIIWIKPYHK